jgi:hemerythrin-like domain-containing protein
MTTKTRETSSGRTASHNKKEPHWPAGHAGTIAAAAMAGAAVGLAANLGRKFVVQNIAAARGDWARILADEHQIVLALFDKMEATEDNQSTTRRYLLAKLKNALGKHAIEEENAVYPTLRDAGMAHEADALNGEHGYVKTYIHTLENMSAEGPAWLAKIREFRAMIEEHMKMEEEEIFPAIRSQLSDERNAALTTAVTREGMKLA